MSDAGAPEPPESGEVDMSPDASLQRAEELLERLRAKLDELERLADAGDADTAVDELTEIAEIAKEIEGEITRARTRADAAR
jgi:predicted translin family RNA/ssDNA-binding protein